MRENRFLFSNRIRAIEALFCVFLLFSQANAQLDREYKVGPDYEDCLELFDDLTFWLIASPTEV